MAEVREAVELLRELHGIGVAPPASITRAGAWGVARPPARAAPRPSGYRVINPRVEEPGDDEMDGRGIRLAYIEATLAAPEKVLPDLKDRALTRSFKAIPEFGNRVLRVVHRPRWRRCSRGHGPLGQGSKAMIRTSYDPEADVLLLRFGPADAKYDGADEVAPGVFLEFDADGNAIGVEVLSVKLRVAGAYGAHAKQAAE